MYVIVVTGQFMLVARVQFLVFLPYPAKYCHPSHTVMQVAMDRCSNTIAIQH